MIRSLSMCIIVRHATKASGEMEVVLGVLRSSSRTRLLAEERKVCNAGKGMPLRKSTSRRGADPAKNPSERAGIFPLYGKRTRVLSAGNGFCIIAVIFANRWLDSESVTLHTRLGFSNEA